MPYHIEYLYQGHSKQRSICRNQKEYFLVVEQACGMFQDCISSVKTLCFKKNDLIYQFILQCYLSYNGLANHCCFRENTFTASLIRKLGMSG